MEKESISLRDLHGTFLTVERDGERVPLTGFTCDNYPDCDECGHINSDLAETEDATSKSLISTYKPVSKLAETEDATSKRRSGQTNTKYFG